MKITAFTAAAKALFKSFKRNRQRVNNLLKKDKSLLTKPEKRILRRLKRAPKGANIPNLDRIYKIKLSPGQSVLQAVKEYSKDADVEYAELNYIVSINLTPNDPLYSVQWPLNNTGQTYPESGRYNQPPGTIDCDIYLCLHKMYLTYCFPCNIITNFKREIFATLEL